MNKNVAIVVLLGGCILFAASCTGGCWLKAGPVRTDPTTDCLALFGGSSASEPTVCAVPNLGGANNCANSLTLPKRSATGDTVVVPPGGTVDWRLPSLSVPPAITVTGATGGQADYAISATLGNQSITITIPVR